MSPNMLKLSRFLFCVLIILIEKNIRASAINVLGGETVTDNGLSFVVSIGNKLMIDGVGNPYGHICGGTLISRQYVLTSASCFSPNIAVENYIVYVGKTFDLRDYKAYGIESWETYDSYRNRNGSYQDYYFSYNDLAIVKLLEVIEACDIAIPQLVKVAPSSLEDRDVIIAGWGQTWSGPCPQCVLKADLHAISLVACNNVIINITNSITDIDDQNFFCTMEKSIATLEESDRGSPVFVRHGLKYVILGVHQKSFPSASEVPFASQTHKHTSLYYYSTFIRLTAKLKYSMRPIFYIG